MRIYSAVAWVKAILPKFALKVSSLLSIQLKREQEKAASLSQKRICFCNRQKQYFGE